MNREKTVENSRKIGAQYEARAAAYLEEQGYRILARNYRCYYSELDIVAMEKDCLVFCEVRFRRDGLFSSLESVDQKKQRRISRAALFYMAENRIREDQNCRFDVVGIDEKEIYLIRHAFDYVR